MAPSLVSVFLGGIFEENPFLFFLSQRGVHGAARITAPSGDRSAAAGSAGRRNSLKISTGLPPTDTSALFDSLIRQRRNRNWGQ